MELKKYIAEAFSKEYGYRVKIQVIVVPSIWILLKNV